MEKNNIIKDNRQWYIHKYISIFFFLEHCHVIGFSFQKPP